MNKKRVLIFAVMLAVLCLLVYLQFRTWKKFDWATFRSTTEHVAKLNLLAGIALTYLAYVMRALRWRIFLKPVCETTTKRLMAPQLIGFSALALLGRAGEMIRPYIIAKKERLTFTSQIAVWGVERIFDMGAFALMLAVSFLSPDLQRLRFYHQLREFAFLLLLLVLGLVIGVVVVRLSGERVGNFLHDRFAGFAPRFAHHLREKIRSFSAGLATIQDIGSALQLIAISIFMWLLIALAYYAITHAYPGRLSTLSLPEQVVLMGSSMVGSMLQLPAVGGGQQVAAIAMLNSGFGVEKELAVSCGILIWAITFMSVVPAGLLLARHEHLSIRAMAEAEEKEAALASE
ncbi:MAG: lysylphosphatidylglycerol synthase transmembrane domain-containing protein [Acidobacteriota bacterium]|nr:lysylphosphatidylglycerol synthase transmembrane domain-containing protein [Acidobacteriota bacterium]